MSPGNRDRGSNGTDDRHIGTDMCIAWDYFSHSVFLAAWSNSRKQIILKKKTKKTDKHTGNFFIYMV